MNDPMEIISGLMSGKLKIIVSETKPEKPKLSPDEQALKDALVAIADRYGKFNEDETGIWAGYDEPKKNLVKEIGVKCSNCALYEGNGICRIIAQKVEDDGKCRFAVIPDGVVKGIYDASRSVFTPRRKKRK